MIWILYNTSTGGVITYSETEPSLTTGQSKIEVDFNFGNSEPFIYKWDGSNIVRNDSIWIKYNNSDGSIIEFSSEEPTVNAEEGKVLKDFFYNPLQPLRFYTVPENPEDPIEVENTEESVNREYRHLYFNFNNYIETDTSKKYIPSKVLGTYVEGKGTDGLTMDSTGRIKNISGKTLCVKALGICSALKRKSGSRDNVTFNIAKDGVILLGSKSSSETSRYDIDTSVSSWIGDLENNSYLEIYATNTEKDVKITVADLSLIVEEL